MSSSLQEEKVTYQKSTKSLEKIKQLVAQIDLGPIKFKLMDTDEGEGWSRDKVESVEKAYRRFLILTTTSGRAIIPTKEIDAFWHQHILDTQKYAEDCQRAFGFFLHHFPYIGLRGNEDRLMLGRLFKETSELYEKMFGEPYGADAQDCENCGNCTASCGVGDHSSRDRIRPTVQPLAV